MNEGTFYGHPFEREHRVIADDDSWLSDMTNWATPEYPRNQVDKAGEVLIAKGHGTDKFLWALAVVNNWRSSHSYPLLHFRINLKRNLKRIEPSAIVGNYVLDVETEMG